MYHHAAVPHIEPAALVSMSARRVDEIIDELRASLKELFPDYSEQDLDGALARMLTYARKTRELPDLPALKAMIKEAYPANKDSERAD